MLYYDLGQHAHLHNQCGITISCTVVHTFPGVSEFYILNAGRIEIKTVFLIITLIADYSSYVQWKVFKYNIASV